MYLVYTTDVYANSWRHLHPHLHLHLRGRLFPNSMEVTRATTLSSFSQFMISLPAASLQPRFNSKKRICVATECSGFNFSSWNVKGLSRRLLFFTGFVPILSNVNLASGAPIPQIEEPEIIRTRKLPGGTRVQDVVDGEGQAANEGDVVVFNYVCRRANGYFVYSTVDQFTGEAKPVTLPLDENQIIKGLKDVLVGMKVGGKRRALIPPSIGYVNENLKPIPEEFGPRRSLLSHANEPLVFEVQLLKIL